MTNNGNKELKGRKLYIHPMTGSGALLLAATFRSIDIDARVLPPSDTRTLELGNMYSSGEECLPEKITLGDYLKITEIEGFEPEKTAFLMPSSDGPCRFGQYIYLMLNVLKKKGLDEVMVISPSSKNGYSDIGGENINFFRTAFVSMLTADILRKMLLKTRPYEKVKGSTDSIYEKGLKSAEKVFEMKDLSFKKRLEKLKVELIATRNEYRAVDADYVKEKPLIGIIGEIFCRHNKFANENIILKLEEFGAETWIADIGEWVFYTEWSRTDNMIRTGKKFSIGMGLAKIKKHIMKNDEHFLLEPFHDDFIGYEEPSDIEEIVNYSEPYLPARGALGEMALNLGRAGYLYAKGIDGIVDISPFSCMNGIVSEAVYPSFSRDHNDLPCRVFFYDGTNLDLDRDVGIFMELIKVYMSRKFIERNYPRVFKDPCVSG